MVDRKSTHRSLKLRELFTAVLKGTKTIDNKNANLFLEAIRDQDSNKALTVQKIQASDYGRAAFQTALSSSTELSFLHQSITPILRYLAAPELKTLCGGVVLQQLILSFIATELVWDAYIAAFKAGKLAGDGECNGEEAFSWLLLELLSLPKEKAQKFLYLAQDNSIKKMLLDSHKNGVRLRANRIAHIVENLIAGHDLYRLNQQSSSRGPGGRHNNDFAEINKIAVLPTTDELAAKEPYLPRAQETRIVAKQPGGLAFYLDSQFRLLREDMLHDLREEIHVVLDMKKNVNGRVRKAFSVEHLSMVGVNCDGRNPWSVQLLCMNDIPQMPKKNELIRRQFLKENPKYLKHESLACIIADDEIVTLGTLVREENLLAANPPILCLQIPSVHEDKALRHIKEAKVVKLVQLSTALFSYAPILEQLKEMKELPFEDEILRWDENNSPKPPDYQLSPIITCLVEELRRNSSQDLQTPLELPCPTKLDKSQAACFITGMTTRLSTIQGPPGTGKSFIGALLAKAIFLYSEEKILVLTYKHHALDQLLIDLINLGIPKTEIVRLGSARKAEPSVRDLAMKDIASLVRLTQQQCDMLNLAKAKVLDEGETLRQAFTGIEQRAPSKDDILEHLEFLTEGPPFFAAFQVPERNDRVTHVQRNGKQKFNDSYLLDRWRRGKDATPFKKIAQLYPEVWNMKASARNNLVREWEAEILKERFDAFQSAGHGYNAEIEQVASIYMERELTVLRSRRVIACTTTAAAKYVQILNSACPGVLLVEEAGEILESHILTALSPNTKQLILIGDHKQLRPKARGTAKVSIYHLQQHRMRPELAGFVRELTYPELVDASSTKNRPSIKGLRDNVIFLNHSHSEEQMKHILDWKDGASPATKRNLFEVHMAINCLRYLGQQDIEKPTEKIVLLAPYLGQLNLLREEIKKTDNDPVLNDLDSHELARAGLMPAATAQANKTKIRISTIDNFQGDESEIVIVTLTRSNDNGDIGFMSSPERLNVLLSRARNGLIIIGNIKTFTSSRKGGQLWKRVIDLLKAKNHIYDGLPVKCEQHPARQAVLRCTEDFQRECPDGGCNEPCDALLKCGVHKCPRSCHWLSDHSKIGCNKILETRCMNGHVQKRKCSETSPLKCEKCEIQARRDHKTLERDMELQDKRLREQAKHELSIADLDMAIRKIREETEDRETARERAQALEQKKRDLETAKHDATQSPATITNTVTSSQASLSHKKPGTDNRKASAVSTPSDRIQSASAAEWERQKRVEGEQNAALDDLMALSGLEEVKEKFLDIKAKIETAARQGIDVKRERMGMVMLGNPGTGMISRDLNKGKLDLFLMKRAGKTTVARIYARFLASAGALPGNGFTEITGSGLANDGVAGAKKIIDGLVKAGGGVFFIDETYQLASGSNFGGKSVLDFILAEIEERRGTIAFILAGYDKEMEKFFEHNPGFDSRMPHRLRLIDYSDEVLLTMLKALVEKKYNGRATIEDDGSDLYARILTKRLGRRRGTEGYGNARDLENVWGQVTERQASRLKKERIAGTFPDDLFFTKEDIIGREPIGVMKECDPWKKLQSLVGLDKVKKSVKALFDAMQRNYQRELKDLDPLEFTLHRVFLGSPGTGKTTVAKLYGSILADMGLLSKREVIVKNPSDFIGSALGQSEENTKKILKAATGKVLLIDEAYGLDAGGDTGSGHKDPYKTAVIDTIVAQVQNTPGEDLCVLLLGYQEQMEKMMHHSNPGLARRFRLSDAFYFEDFGNEELMCVLEYKLKEQGLKATEEAKRTAIEVLAKERDRPNFGNAGAVENIISRAKELEQKRTSAAGLDTINPEVMFLPQDFDEEYDRASGTGLSCRELFADIVGCETIIDQFEKYQRIAKNMKTKGKDPRTQVPFSFLFKGPPGTGKTTVARKMGQLYYDMGILASSEYVECSASDLIGQYVGQTGPKTQGKLTEALGRVLFVDEAYRFCDGQFGKEAVNELVDCLTKQKYIGKVVVILAGYTHQIDELLQINPGLSSRFPEEVVFTNMDPQKCAELLGVELKKSDIKVIPPLNGSVALEQRQQMIYIFTQLSNLRSWGNGRDVKNIAKDICLDAFASNASKELSVTYADILRHLDKMLKSQRSRNESRIDSRRPKKLDAFPSLRLPKQDLPKAPITKTSIASNAKMTEPVPTKEKALYIRETLADVPDASERDPGVSDKVWKQLQRNIAEEKTLKQTEDMLVSALKHDYELHTESEFIKLKEIQILEEEKKLADEIRLKIIKEQLIREKERLEAILKAKREAEERLRKAQEEAERKRQQELAVQKKIRDMGICPAGFRWIKVGGGYRCGGGSHYLSNSQLGI